METVAGSLRWAEWTLAQSPNIELLESCKVDSQWLLCHVLQQNSAWLRAWPDQLLTAAQWSDFQALVQRRLAGEPVAYLTGSQGFWQFDQLLVSADTLVPRPDTELLVELTLGLSVAPDARVVDLGTGTGAIALALKFERPQWMITATDIHDPTLQVARHNGSAQGLQIDFVCSDWFAQLEGQRFHIVVSNPPYIEDNDEHLQGVGVRYEPRRALVSGRDGLDAIRHIVSVTEAYMEPGGWLLLEHGYKQGEAVRELLRQASFENVETHQDLADRDRVTLGRLPMIEGV